MNGSGTPVSGARPSTAKMLSVAWQRISDVTPAGDERWRSGPCALLRDAQAGVGDEAVEEEQREHADARRAPRR